MKNFILLLISFSTIFPVSSYSQEIEKNSFKPKSGTVVLVHGFMRSKMNMSALEYSLKKDGWKVINWAYPSRKKLIEEHAEDLITQLKEIIQHNPNKPISFVTHSMGGLVVRCALNQPDCPIEAKIGRAVLIAPPNRGSIFARSLQKYKLIGWVVGEKSGQQLMTTSLDGFDHIGSFPMEMPVMIIAGTAGLNPAIPEVNDGKVAVSETYLKTPHHHATCYAGHSWICYTPSVIQKTKTFLSSQNLSCHRLSSKK